MTPWKPFTKENVESIPEGSMGVFQLAKGEENIAYVGRSDSCLKKAILEFIDKGYSHFQWNALPWAKETFEMQCRLYHHAGGHKSLDNIDHPYPADGSFAKCPVSAMNPAMCES